MTAYIFVRGEFVEIPPKFFQDKLETKGRSEEKSPNGDDGSKKDSLD